LWRPEKFSATLNLIQAVARSKTPLTTKQALFVAEFCQDFNATDAARRAGYSRNVARVQGLENLQKPAVQAAIGARLKPRLKRLGLSLDSALEEYRWMAFVRPGPYFQDADGELLPLSEWPKGERQACISLLALKRQALKDVLEYLRHAGVYGQPDPTPVNNLTVNNVTVVPLSKLSDEELEFYRSLAAKGRAIQIESSRPAPSSPGTDAGADA
jgi:hypothetical protein